MVRCFENGVVFPYALVFLPWGEGGEGGRTDKAIILMVDGIS